MDKPYVVYAGPFGLYQKARIVRLEDNSLMVEHPGKDSFDKESWVIDKGASNSLGEKLSQQRYDSFVNHILNENERLLDQSRSSQYSDLPCPPSTIFEKNSSLSNESAYLENPNQYDRK